MCGYRKREDGTKMFSPPGGLLFLFSLHLKIFPFLVLEKRFLCFVVFASCVVVRRRHSAFLLEDPPQKSRHVLLC